MVKPVIKQHVIFGDSLSDRGILAEDDVLALAGGLMGNSPRGRFANGFGWVDLVASFGMADFTLYEMKKKRKFLLDKLGDSQDHEAVALRNKIANIDDNDLPALFRQFRRSFNLDNPSAIFYIDEKTGKNEIYFRCYAKGGAAAYSWKFNAGELFKEPSEDLARLLLSNLEKERTQLLKDDETYGITPEQKATTLVTDWSGANDLITLNDTPITEETVNDAVKARIDNVRAMIAAGYKNFVLINLPDFSLTPRFQTSGNEALIENASAMSALFNKKLQEGIEALKGEDIGNGCYFDIFDVASIFKDAYDNPEKYGFDSELKTQYYTASEELESARKNKDDVTKKVTPDTGFQSHELHFMGNLPRDRDLKNYKNSYIMCDQTVDSFKLYYINDKGKKEQVQITNQEEFRSKILTLKQGKGLAEYEDGTITLRPEKVRELITLNGGHKPDKGYYMFWNNVHPSAMMQAILGKKFAEKYDKIFNYQPPGAENDVEEQEYLKYKDRLNKFSELPVSEESARKKFADYKKLNLEFKSYIKPEDNKAKLDKVKNVENDIKLTHKLLITSEYPKDFKSKTNTYILHYKNSDFDLFYVNAKGEKEKILLKDKEKFKDSLYVTLKFNKAEVIKDAGPEHYRGEVGLTSFEVERVITSNMQHKSSTKASDIPESIQKCIDEIEKHRISLLFALHNRSVANQKRDLLKTVIQEINAQFIREDLSPEQKCTKAVQIVTTLLANQELSEARNPTLDRFFKVKEWKPTSVTLLNKLSDALNVLSQTAENNNSNNGPKA